MPFTIAKCDDDDDVEVCLPKKAALATAGRQSLSAQLLFKPSRQIRSDESVGTYMMFGANAVYKGCVFASSTVVKSNKWASGNGNETIYIYFLKLYNISIATYEILKESTEITRIIPKQHVSELRNRGKLILLHSRVPSKRVAIVSKNVFCGASSPLRAGIWYRSSFRR